MEITAVDVVVVIIMLIAGIRCAFRGFVAEFMTFASIIISLVLAFAFASMLSPYLEPYIGDSLWTPLAAFLGIFLLSYIVLKLFEGGMYKLIDRIHLEKADQALGLFLGLIEGFLVVVLLYVLLKIQPLFDAAPLFQNSFFAPILEKILPIGGDIIDSAMRGTRV